MSDDNKIVPLNGKTEPKKKRKYHTALAKRNEALSTPEGREISKSTLNELMIEYNQPKVMSDNQLRQRLNAYLNRCVKSGQYPTIEEGLLSTGYSKSFMLEIAQGKSRGRYFTPEAAEIIQKFVDIVAAFDAKMVLEGKLPQIPYIYRSKNYYGMSDKAEVQFTGDVNVEHDININDIAKRYAVEGAFVEDAEPAQEGEE